jgi:SAM-dependent methyltransferase
VQRRTDMATLRSRITGGGLNFAWRAMRAISSLGQRWDIDWLTYNPLLFAWYHLRARLDAPAVVETLGRLWPEAMRYLDVGAGTGTYSAIAQRSGRHVLALERSRVGRLFGRLQGVRTDSFELASAPSSRNDGPFDLALCLEVAEHLTPRMGDRLVEFLARHAPVVVFTAAPPGQGGIGHVNEQERDYWVARFERRGLGYNQGLSRLASQGFLESGVYSDYLARNVMVFERRA